MSDDLQGEGRLGLRLMMAAAAVSLAGVVILVSIHFRHQARHQLTAKADARKNLVAAAASVDAELRTVMSFLSDVAAELGAAKSPPAQILEARFRDMQAKESPLITLGAAYQPHAHDPAVKLYAPHFGIEKGTPEAFQLETIYDYTVRDWFKLATEEGGGWLEPHLYSKSETLVVTYTLPIRPPGQPGAKPIGAVRASLAIARVERILGKVSLGSTGIGYLISRKGTYLTHPRANYVLKRRNIVEVSKADKNPAMELIAQKALRGERADKDAISVTTGAPIWYVTEPLSATGWSFIAIFVKAEMTLPAQIVRRERIRVALCLMVFLSILCGLLLRVDRGTSAALWGTAATISVLCLATTGFMWYVTLSVPDADGAGATLILDHASSTRFQATHRRDPAKPPSTYVPTGVFVQTIRISGPTEVLVTGYVWQKYRLGTDDWISRGFSLPESEALTTTEAYRRKDGKSEVIGWYFKATIREKFSNSQRYPFDRGQVRLRLWHADFDKNVLLAPDLAAYKLLLPRTRPGIDRDLILPGWSIERTFFSYITPRYFTNFGISSYVGGGDVPELVFNIAMRRFFLDPFISNLMSVLVVTSILFALLICGTKNPEAASAVGFKGMGSLGAAAGLLFAVILAQINLRQKVVTSEVIYLEYFYFVAYMAIIAVASNAILFSVTSSIKFVEYRDNLFPKLVYWPSVTAAFLVVTMLNFY